MVDHADRVEEHLMSIGAGAPPSALLVDAGLEDLLALAEDLLPRRTVGGPRRLAFAHKREQDEVGVGIILVEGASVTSKADVKPGDTPDRPWKRA
jgi:hypothetical protein